ncbi:MAG: hypothetical protein JSR37_09265 [Verrucomicrobia bacterium]|nr:hypothetical protein [Verrucomicrobiota bacterium]MBS0636344.1 hypothetical protein [Verrucomicrobiota bacterium]
MKNIKLLLALLCATSTCAYAEESSVDQLKAALEKAEDKIEEMAKALQEYDWKGAYDKATTFGPVSLSDVTVNGNTRAAIVEPGQEIKCTATVHVDQEKMKNLKLKRVVVGINDVGPQTSFSISSNKEQNETFTLTAPKEPGLYQVRYRPVINDSSEWLDPEGKAPGFTYTIAMIWVKKPDAKK